MNADRVRNVGGRLIVSIALASLLALLPVPTVGLLMGSFLSVGATVSSAQGGMDVGILTPGFSELPLSVLPGQSFVVGVTTAPGARCAGRLTFRNQPPLELEAVPAPGGSCGWTVEVPPTARPGTGTVVVDIARSGQTWALVGVVYVSPVGEAR